MKRGFLIILIFIIIFVIIGGSILIKGYKENKNVSDKEISNNLNITEKEKNEISKYIQNIYVIPTVEMPKKGWSFPLFNSINDEDNKEWIYSTAYAKAQRETIIAEDGSVKISLDALNKQVIELYGKNVNTIKDKTECERVYLYEQDENELVWNGDAGDINETAHYIIKNFKKIDNNKYNIEIAEVVSEQIWNDEGFTDIYKLMDYHNSYLCNVGQEEITKYLEENKDTLPSKILTIEYNLEDGFYHILSSRAK